MASSDFAIGSNRVSFLLVRADNSLVTARVADVFYRPIPEGPTRKALARLVPIGVGAASAEKDEIKQIYVASLELPKAGKQWIVVQPRGVAFQGFQILDVKARSTAVAVGDRAPASNNPTLATKPASKLTTSRPPDTGLLRYSVAESLKAGVPFVVAFATPAFCQSRTCGPDGRRRRRGAKALRSERDSLHPHRDLPRQPARQRCQPLGQRVEAPDGTVGVRRRSKRRCSRSLRGSGLCRGARPLRSTQSARRLTRRIRSADESDGEPGL